MTINCFNITTLDDDSFRLLRNVVSEKRRRAADSFRFADDSKRCISAEVLLRYGLLKEAGQSCEPKIIYNEFGKPSLSNINGFFYNISHSGKWVVIACGNTEVGVDIEKIQTIEKNIYDKYFTKEEKKYICASEEDEQKKAIQIWTLKESYIKYKGTGLSADLHSFSVNAQEGTVRDKIGIQDRVVLKSFPFDTDYYLSVCSAAQEINIQEVMLKDLMREVNPVY